MDESQRGTATRASTALKAAAAERRVHARARDFVALSTTMPSWMDAPAATIAENLCEVLVSELRVDAAFVELRDPTTRELHVAKRGTPHTEAWFAGVAFARPSEHAASSRADDVAGLYFASQPIGVEGELGRLGIGCSRQEFPERLELLALEVAANQIAAAMRHAELVAGYERAEELLRCRAAQQELVARLGRRALTGLSLGELLSEAVTGVRDTLRVDYSEIFECTVDDAMPLLLRAGRGWPEELIGQVRVDTGTDSLPGQVLRFGEPVIVTDASTEEQLTGPVLLREQGVVSSACVIIRGRDAPFGVFGTHHRTRRAFTPEEVHFQESVANVIATAVERTHAEQERYALIARTEQAKAEALAQSTAKSQFLGMMSHELRTPLTATLGYAELIDAGVHGPVTDAQRADLARIRRSQEYLVRLIDNVLNFLSVGGGRVHFSVEDVPLADALASVNELVLPSMQAKGLRYERQGAVEGVHVRADRQALEQILVNLLSNARKFTAGGGSVRLVCDPGPEKVRIHVADTGRGIPADKLRQVFEPFARLDQRSSTEEGTGLGLTISRDFAAGMGAEILVTSEVGVGSTFTLVVPRSASPPQPPNSPAWTANRT